MKTIFRFRNNWKLNFFSRRIFLRLNGRQATPLLRNSWEDIMTYESWHHNCFWIIKIFTAKKILWRCIICDVTVVSESFRWFLKKYFFINVFDMKFKKFSILVYLIQEMNLIIFLLIDVSKENWPENFFHQCATKIARKLFHSYL